MKPSIILCFLSFAFPLIAQQSEIKGIISIHNSEYETGKRQYVPNAQVEDDFAKTTPQITDANGNFKLVFVRIPEKTSVQLIVKKEDLQVVNIDGLSAVTGQRDLVRLSMAKPDKIAEYRRQIYQVGKTEAEKNLAAQLKKKGEQIETLQKDAVKNKAAIEKVQKEYAELQAFASKIEEQAQDLARRYAPINLDDAAPLYRESFRLFQQGELDKAMQILKGASLVSQANKILAEEKRLSDERRVLNKQDSIKEQRKKDLMQVLGLKADLHKAKFEWDSVLFCLELRVNLDSTNVDNIWDFAVFLSEQNKINEAITYYEKALVLAQSPILKASFLNNLGVQYRANQKMALAEAAYLEALKIYRQLADKYPDASLPFVAGTLNNLGLYYQTNQKMPQAEAAYLEVLKIYRQLVDKYPDEFLPDLAMTLNNLGLYYRDNQKMPQAEAAYQSALKIYQQLAEKKPDDFFPKVAAVLDNLGLYYRNNQKMPQAEVAHSEALKIYRQLVDKNSDKFLPDLAMTLNNLGIYYYVNQKMPQAEDAYVEAIKIYRHLADKNPNAFLPVMAAILDNLGSYYSTNQKMPQAEAAHVEALKLYRQLVKKNPEAFLPDLAMTLNNLGLFFKRTNNHKTALEHYEESLHIFDTAILGGEIHQFKNWVQLFSNISIVKDAAQLIKDYKIISYATRLLAESCYRLKEVDERLKILAVSKYSDLSWWALLAKDYALSEKAALRCLELDNTHSWVLSNLGHSQLLRGQYAAAKATYEKLKGKKNDKGQDYKQVLLGDLNALETEGITHKDFAQARTAIEKW